MVSAERGSVDLLRWCLDWEGANQTAPFSISKGGDKRLTPKVMVSDVQKYSECWSSKTRAGEWSELLV